MKPLSPREIEVVKLIAEGKSSRQVSELLEISVRTVEAHRQRVMIKVGANSVADLVRYALRTKLIQVAALACVAQIVAA